MLNRRQNEIFDSLRNISPQIAELFKGAVLVLSHDCVPNEAKLRFVVHAGREICTRLPAIVSGNEFNRFNHKSAIEEIRELIKKEGLKDFKYAEKCGEPEKGNELISVSSALIEKILALCKGDESISGTRRKKAEALIVGLVPENQENPEAIIPLINEIKSLEDYFQSKTHVREGSTSNNIDELDEKFDLLETALHSLCGYYFSGYEEIRSIVEQANSALTAPSDEEINKTIAKMGVPQFYRYFFENIKNHNWLDALKSKKIFENPPNAEKFEGTTKYRSWPPGKYLTTVAGRKPEKVLEILKDIDTDNIYVMEYCIQAMGRMPAEVAAGGIELAKRLLSKEFDIHWHFVGEEIAKLIVKFAEGEKWEEAFGIAEELLEVRVKEGKSFQSWHDLEGRIDDYGYRELIFKYFKVLWEKDKQGLRAGMLLVEILDEQIEKEQQRKDKEPIPEEIARKYKEILGDSKEEKKSFEITEHSYIMMRQIEVVEKEHPDIADILVGGIRTIGEYLMQNNPDEAEEYIEYLQDKERSLYERIVIHLHRYAPDNEKWNPRIKNILRDTKNVENYNTANEYKGLLNDKYKMLIDEDKKPFYDWVEERVKIKDEDMEGFQEWYQDGHGHRADDIEIEQYQSYLRAQELYCIKDKEPKYQEYLEKSGKSEKAVKPREDGAFEYSTGAPKFSPLSQEEMQKKTPEEVIRYILEYDLSHDDKNEFSEEDGHEVDRKEALASVFSNDLKERMEEYLQVEVSIISGLSRRYIRNFLYAVREVLQNKKIEEPNWDTLIELCQVVYDSRSSDENYREPMQVIPNIFELALKGDSYNEIITPKHIETIWGILASLLDYQFEMDEEEDEDYFKDPHQKCINRVRGVSFQNIIRFGLFCKKHYSELFEKKYTVKLREELQYVLNDVDRPHILCEFGVFFVNLCWLDEQWVRDNIDRIFPEDDPRKWEVIWGSYVKWSRTSELSFAIVKGKYLHAVNMIEEKIKYDGEESYYKRLMGHIMLAYWQGWTSLEENDVVWKLLAKMDDPMRANACHWLSSGFEYLKKHTEDDWHKGVVQRMREYWNRRYSEMKKNPSAHSKEAREFTGWVKDSPFGEEKTLAIAEKAVELAGGVAVRRRDMDDFVEGICAIAEGRELRVLQLLQIAIDDPEVERWSWDYKQVQEHLIKFMDKIVELQDNYEEIKTIRQAAIKIADSLGRFGFEFLRPHYDKLTGKK